MALNQSKLAQSFRNLMDPQASTSMTTVTKVDLGTNQSQLTSLTTTTATSGTTTTTTTVATSLNNSTPPHVIKTTTILVTDPSPSFAGFAASQSAAFGNFASAYDSYAKDATDELGNAVSGGSASAFRSALSSLAKGAQAAATASAFANAFSAYWLGATFATSTPPPGFASLASNIVTAAPPTALQSALVSLFASGTLDGNARSSALASAFHTASSTIILLATGVTPTGAPISAPGVVL